MQLKNLYNHFASHKESQWIMKAPNAQALYQFVKEHKIKKVLDLGTGIGFSSAIIALALKDKGETDYHIDTVEQFDKCITIAKKMIPDELQKNITFHKSEAVVWQTDKIPYQVFSIYETLPEGDYDLICNDGPSPMLLDGHFIDLSNATITKMLLEDKLKAGTFVVWDGRFHMLAILERYFADNFYLARPAQRGDGLNILEKKDTPVIFKDSKLEAMKQFTYFKDENTKSSQ